MSQKKWTSNYEKKHPFKNKWFKLRYRAKRRGIEFDLTYEQFRDFCLEHQLEGKTGRKADNLSIDRINSERGYSIDNIQVLTVSENSSKSKYDVQHYLKKLKTPKHLIPHKKDPPF